MSAAYNLPTVIRLALAGLVLPLLLADVVPTPTVQIRLKTEVSSDLRPGTTFDATTLGTTAAGFRDSGCLVTGHVAETKRPRRGEPAALRISFDRVRDASGVERPFAAELEAVDNAREHLTDGTIVGLKPLTVHPSVKGDLLMAAAYAHPILLATYLGIRLERKELDHPSIRFSPGVVMRVRPRTSQTAPLDCGPQLPVVDVDAGMSEQVNALPAQTQAGEPPRAADWINLVFAGRRADLESAFEAAGWVTAVKATMRVDVRTFLAVAEREAYNAGPVSLLTLDGRAPDLVFQQQTDTFSQRHHIRIWSAAGAPDSSTTWVAAATHDIAVELSHETHTFTHRIAPAVDDEREFVVASLVSGASVRASGWLARPAIPQRSLNAAGDPVVTDGRAAVVFLSPGRAEF